MKLSGLLVILALVAATAATLALLLPRILPSAETGEPFDHPQVVVESVSPAELVCFTPGTGPALTAAGAR